MDAANAGKPKRRGHNEEAESEEEVVAEPEIEGVDDEEEIAESPATAPTSSKSKRFKTVASWHNTAPTNFFLELLHSQPQPDKGAAATSRTSDVRDNSTDTTKQDKPVDQRIGLEAWLSKTEKQKKKTHEEDHESEVR